LEQLIGFFVNTLVLRSDLSGNPTFRQLLGRVRATTLDAYAHQDLPFERVVDELQPERDLSRNPLCQVVFALQNAPLGTLELPGLTFSTQPFESTTTRFDLECHLWEVEAGLQGVLIYSTDLFAPETIRRLLAHYQALLHAVVADPDRPLASYQLLSTAERAQLLDEWNETRTEYPPDTALHERFEQQAAERPDSVALVFADDALTYGELNERANQLAHYLRRLGVGPETVVGLCVERSFEMIVGLLGILKAGGAYLPLDPAYPRERLSFMVTDAGARLLLTERALRAQFADDVPHIVCLEEWREQMAREAVTNPARANLLDHLVYITYTSGSTGQPKGVAMTHRPLVNIIDYQLRRSGAQARPRTLQFASLSFDASVQEIFSALSAGATLVLISEDEKRDVHAWLGVVVRERVARLFVPFVALQQLAEEATADERLLPVSLREIITAGEQLKITRDIRSFFNRLEACRLDNQYGPSEAHVITAALLAGDPASWPELPPIGRPVDHAQLYLLDEQMQPVPIGVTGQLYVGGVPLARGYVGQPAQTAARFVPHPFARQPGARLYRTGDLARYRPDGQIEFLGRADSQVKVRGYRIEPGEIEAVLAGHTALSAAVVVVRTNETGQKRLVAYVVAAPGQPPPTVSELRQFLLEKMPDYMVPSFFVMLAELPLTVNGKVDYRALPAPDTARLELATDYAAPRTSTEETLAHIWAKVLGLERVGMDDDFFALGGDSLLATQLVSRVRQAFQIELPLRELFRQRTVAQLARLVEETLIAQLDELSDEEAEQMLRDGD
jgi:amino acid adenylation domain-containing protein